jgi:hypothetical protein
MKNNKYSFWLLIAVFALALLFSSFVNSLNKRNQLHFPYQKAGLTSAQAAAHLLSRFTYGASPSDLDLVQKIGLENWFEQQLAGNLADEELNVKLSRFDAINLSNTEAENIFPRNAQLINFAIKEGYLNKDSVNKSDNKAYRDKIQALMKAKGYRPQQELFRQLISQKVLRATYTKNQMRELMTDFWFNHFNVSLNKNQCAIYIPAFERDVIRPNVFGKFEDLLLATAKSPAMLMYLDNSASSSNNASIQEKIEKNYDIRVNVIDNELVSVAIYASEEDKLQGVDIRRNNMQNVRYEIITLPSSLENKILAICHSYNLRFASVDMAFTNDLQYVFFEINPNGQWAWLDLEGVTDIAHLLIKSMQAKIS